MASRDEVILCSVGDLMICDSPLYVSVGVGSEYSKIKGRIFDSCRDIFGKSDLLIGNLESIVHYPNKYNLKEIQMSCSEEVITELSEAGFSVLNLANNHCLQHGTKAFYQTDEICKSKGIHCIGKKNEEPWIINKNGIRIAFVSLCVHMEWYQPENILYEDDIQRVLLTIQEMRKIDKEVVIVVSIHWGDEFAIYPSNAQIKLAHKFVDLGADVILGHHAHVFQGIEYYNNSLIVYGQGNFVSDMVPALCRETGIVEISIAVENRKRKIQYNVFPYYINEEFIPIPSDSGWLKQRQEELLLALRGEYTDDDYWRMIRSNHMHCHDDFKRKFINEFFSYKINISSQMIKEFVIRKMKQYMGKSSPGRKGSMDQKILTAIENVEEL